LGRMFLHAARLSFEHPGDGSMRTLEAPLDAELEGVLAALPPGPALA
jgi:hypothetical protein